MIENDKIYIAGGQGQLGQGILRNLQMNGYMNILTPGIDELDLCDRKSVEDFFEKETPKYVFFCAAYIGGIEFKREHPANIFIKNMEMTLNVLECARKYNVKKLIYLATALVYPNDVFIPTPETAIKTVIPEGTDAPYTLVKFSGMKLCEYYRQEYECDYVTVIPCNFFGPYAPFDGSKAGVVPSLIRRMHEAKENGCEEVVVWGTGNAGRDFLGVDDVADACVYVMKHYNGDKPLNIGSGNEITIREAAEIIKDVVKYEGRIVFDKEKPEGRAHMLLDVTKLNEIGWQKVHSFKESVRIAYEWFLEQ